MQSPSPRWLSRLQLLQWQLPLHRRPLQQRTATCRRRRVHASGAGHVKSRIESNAGAAFMTPFGRMPLRSPWPHPWLASHRPVASKQQGAWQDHARSALCSGLTVLSLPEWGPAALQVHSAVPDDCQGELRHPGSNSNSGECLSQSY